MITIEPNGDGYTMKFSGGKGSGLRGYTVEARSIEEVHEAINHFERKGPRVQQHINNEIGHCPLCRRGGGSERPPLRVVGGD